MKRLCALSSAMVLLPLLLLLPSLLLSSARFPLAAASQHSLYNYIGAMTGVDGSIFGAMTSLYNGVGGIQPDNTISYGSRIFLADSAVPQESMISLSTAFRMDTLGELFVSILAVYLDNLGKLPCGLDLPLGPSVLPPFFKDVPFLTNGVHTTTPITLRNLLEHTSTLTEIGFMEYARTSPTTTELMTNDEFVASLFDTHGYGVFNQAIQPGLTTSFFFSRTNIALATYILNTQLAVMLDTSSEALAEGSVDFGTYIMNELLPLVGMSSTFVLSRTGKRSNAGYPPHITTDWLPYISMQDVNSSGTGAVESRTIHPAYTSDYMFYTTVDDLMKLMGAVMTPGGVFYWSVGAKLAAQPTAVSNAVIPYVTHRGLGVFNMSITRLCAAMASIAPANEVPSCLYDSTNSAFDTAAFGIFASGEYNQVAMICFPMQTGQPWCSASEVSYFQNASNVLSDVLQSQAAVVVGGATFYNWALLLSVANIADYTSLSPTPPPNTTEPPSTPPPGKRPSSTKNFGLWVFIGVLAVVVVVVVASYVADYFIQPAPPAKVVVPVPIVPNGVVGGGNDGTFNTQAIENGFASIPRLIDGGEGVDGVSPNAFRSSPGLPPTRLSLDDDETTMTTTTTTTTTGTTTTSTGATASTSTADTSMLSTGSLGVSPGGMRRRKKNKGMDEGGSMPENGSSSSNSPSAGNDRSTSNSQRPSRGDGAGGSKEYPRFDAYI